MKDERAMGRPDSGDLGSRHQQGVDEGIWEYEETFPPTQLAASRRDLRLQREHRREVTELERANAHLLCPDCGSADRLAWFWFDSPEWTWERFCGRAGVIAFCDAHERQVAFFLHVMN